MKTCDTCSMKADGKDWCDYYMRQITVRDYEKQCNYHMEKKS